jgi:hypothetical protein
MKAGLVQINVIMFNTQPAIDGSPADRLSDSDKKVLGLLGYRRESLQYYVAIFWTDP